MHINTKYCMRTFVRLLRGGALLLLLKYVVQRINPEYILLVKYTTS